MKYLATSYSSVSEFGISIVGDDYRPSRDECSRVFGTFTEAKKWLVKDRKWWTDQFRSSERAARRITKKSLSQ